MPHHESASNPRSDDDKDCECFSVGVRSSPRCHWKFNRDFLRPETNRGAALTPPFLGIIPFESEPKGPNLAIQMGEREHHMSLQSRSG